MCNEADGQLVLQYKNAVLAMKMKTVNDPTTNRIVTSIASFYITSNSLVGDGVEWVTRSIRWVW